MVRTGVGMVLAVALVAGGGAADGQTRTTAKRGGSPEAAKITNPVEPSPASIAAGRRVYQRLCIRCHGAEGKGDGSESGGAQPADLTDAQWDFGATDGDIFTAIHDGTSADMDGYAARLSDTDIWNVVNYLRSIGPKK
jgi:mono/diheme cytochrome c family protein